MRRDLCNGNKRHDIRCIRGVHTWLEKVNRSRSRVTPNSRQLYPTREESLSLSLSLGGGTCRERGEEQDNVQGDAHLRTRLALIVTRDAGDNDSITRLPSLTIARRSLRAAENPLEASRRRNNKARKNGATSVNKSVTSRAMKDLIARLVTIILRSAERRSPTEKTESDRKPPLHLACTCAPRVTDNGRLSGPADKTGSPSARTCVCTCVRARPSQAELPERDALRIHTHARARARKWRRETGSSAAFRHQPAAASVATGPTLRRR